MRVRHTWTMEQQSSGRRATSEPGASSIPSRLDALTSKSAERVLKRAIQLQSDSEFADPKLDPPALERVAAELGIDVSHVRRALLEEFSRPEPRTAQGWTDRLFAPRTLSTRFVATGPLPELDRTIDTWMTKHEGLRPTRRAPDGVTWVKNPSALTSIRQGLKLSQGTGSLRSLRQVTHTVESISDDQHIVSIEADTGRLTNLGVGLAGGGLLGSVVAGTVIAAAADALSVWSALSIALTVLMTFLIAAVVSTKVWAAQVENGLERAADGIAHTDLMPIEESVPHKIARFIDDFRQFRDEIR